MFSRRQVLLGGTAIATVAAAGTAFVVRALSGRSPPGEEVVAWLRANTIPLVSTEPGSDDQDLEALHPVVGHARIVSLGRTASGSSTPALHARRDRDRRSGADRKPPRWDKTAWLRNS